MNLESLKMNKEERTGLWVVIVIIVLLSIVSISAKRCSTDVPEEARQKAIEFMQTADSVADNQECEVPVTKNTTADNFDAESPLKRELPEIKD